MSDKIKPHHRERKAILYIRQSSAYQVHNNLESQKLQYAMQERLHSLGWREVEVVDEDLGRSAAGTVTRTGFERMVAEVCLGQVGAVAAREVSRFARNSREWQRLVEVCRVVDTLLIDQEMVYTPRLSNDRLLLGLKGSLNEYELDLLRQRSVEARREKARRGELIVMPPAGYVKNEDEQLEKDPDRRVQEAVLLVFRKFLEFGSARQTLLWFLEQGLQVPVAAPRGKVLWRRPRYSTIYILLSNPMYAGAYAYGKTEHTTSYENGTPRRRSRRKAKNQWWALIPGTHEGYISWKQFEEIQQMMTDNNHRERKPGAAKRGSALLAGLLRCRRCGRKLMVSYSGREPYALRYSCHRSYLDNGEKPCISFGGLPLDEALSQKILAVVEPAAVEAATLAREEEMLRRDDALEALRRDWEAARYEAQRAQKQYDTTDPENRLVARELERRWNQALERVQDLERRIAQQTQPPTLGLPPRGEEFASLARELEAAWNDPASDVRIKKRIVRTLIHEVIVDVDAQGGELIAVIHWQGGIHTELRLPRRRRGQNGAHTSHEIVEAVQVLARVCSDDTIAGTLTRNGLLTGRGNRWTRERVISLRSHHGIPRYSEEQRKVEGWMSLTEAAAYLGVSGVTLRLAVERGEIEAEHPLADGPWVFHRRALETEAAAKLVERAHRSGRTPALATIGQSSLHFPTT
jgi:DNA invertase Pin-like site-specific DNA recombinase